MEEKIRTVGLKVFDNDELIFDGWYSAYRGWMSQFLNHLTRKGYSIVLFL